VISSRESAELYLTAGAMLFLGILIADLASMSGTPTLGVILSSGVFRGILIAVLGGLTTHLYRAWRGWRAPQIDGLRSLETRG
jgi:hypothetical protein